ncbi:MAG: hypothetical protein RLZZ244_806 [Verrucomicrobiota bacterium]|jgi:Fic family protein
MLHDRARSAFAAKVADMMPYFHERSGWPHFTWDAAPLASLLANVRNRQGRLLGRMDGLGFKLRTEASLTPLTSDVLKSSAIEGDLTLWLRWFLNCLGRALDGAEATLGHTLRKARVWDRIKEEPVNTRQKEVLHRLLDGFEGKLTSSKYAKLAKFSPDTALRDIQQLVQRGILAQNEAGGWSTSYELSESGHGSESRSEPLADRLGVETRG